MKPSQKRQQQAEQRDAGSPRVSAPAVELRTLGDDEAPGTFEAIVAVFGNIDSYGDRMVAGSFTRTLKAPPEGRGYPPVVWTHDWLTPPIGPALEAREVSGDEADEIAGKDLAIDGGLYIKGRLLVDLENGEDHAVARQVHAAMRTVGGDGRPPLREFSFGFRRVSAEWVEEDPDTLPPDLQWTGGEIRNLTDVDLYEVGPTLVGANDATALLGVKSSLAVLESRGLISSDDARKMLREMGDSPRPNSTAERRSAPPAVDEEVKARIDQLSQMLPPETIA